MRGQSGGEVSLKTIGIIAFVFGVFLHGCVAWSVLDDEGLPTADDLPVSVATATAVPQGTVAPTVLPDRTSCDEIRGTEYRSEAERDFFRRNCITTIAPVTPPSGPALGQSIGTNRIARRHAGRQIVILSSAKNLAFGDGRFPGGSSGTSKPRHNAGALIVIDPA